MLTIEKRYYKPHFGPEETDNLILQENERRMYQKMYVNDQLHAQMDLKKNMTENNNLIERLGDLQNLQRAQEMFVAEESAMRNKVYREK